MNDDTEHSKPVWFKRTITRPANQFERDAVIHVQRVLRCPETGEMDEPTITHIRGMQALFGLRLTGVIDLDTAEQIERIRSYGSV